MNQMAIKHPSASCLLLEAVLEVLVADLLRLVARIWHLGNQGFS